jgi:hypothetical protein
VAKDTRIYPPNSDGHPLERGYAVIASAIADELKSRKWI